MATNLTIYEELITTVASTADITVGSFVNAKGGFLTVTPAADDTDTAYAEASNCYFDLSNSTGVQVFHGTSQVRTQHRDLTTTDDTFWSRDSGGTAVVAGSPSLTATDITISFSASAIGHRIHIVVFGGSDVQAKAYAKTGSPMNQTTFTPNLIFGGIYVSAFNAESTSLSRLWTGVIVGPTIVQGGVAFIPEEPENRTSTTQWMPKVPFSGFQSTCLTITSTGFTYDVHPGPIVGLCLDTGGSVSVKSLTIPSTKGDGDTIVLPDAGFDLNDGFMMSWSGTNDLDTDDTISCLSIGTASTTANQRAGLAFRDAATEFTRVESSSFVTSMTDESPRTEFICSIPSVGRNVTMDIDTAGGYDLGVIILYVETIDSSAAPDLSITVAMF